MAAFLVGSGVLGVSTPADATVIRPLTLSGLVERADRVVRARVRGAWSAWASDERRIFTWTELEVLETWTGAVEDAVVVRTLGGVVGEIGMKVSGTPQFSPGAEVVVFLRAARAGAAADEPATFEVVGMSQGKFDVDAGQAVPDGQGLAFAQPRPDAPTPPLPTLPVDELRARVVAQAGLLPVERSPGRVPLAPPVPSAPTAPNQPPAPVVPSAPSAPGFETESE